MQGPGGNTVVTSAAAAGTRLPDPPTTPLPADSHLDTGTLIRKRDTLFETARNERGFLLLVGVASIAAAASTPFPEVARWIGFLLAAYSTVANDSIQTVGTFIASNEHRRWWVLWAFIGGVFLVVVTAGWLTHGGDVSYGRLSAKGFTETPQAFTFLQVAAPVVLLILTRLRMPVSTSVLILSCFATEASGVGDVLIKSVSGYGVAFVTAVVAFGATARVTQRYMTGKPSRWWVPAQWIATATLWSSWIMQDMANLAVYLPRTLNVTEFLAFVAVVAGGLGVLFFLRGDKIQRIVSEKSSVVDIRPATTIDFVYAVILFVFVKASPIPMSTTWVFIGLLAGRELVMILLGASDRPFRQGLRIAGRDLLYTSIGLVVSILLAIVANPVFHDAILGK